MCTPVHRSDGPDDGIWHAYAPVVPEQPVSPVSALVAHCQETDPLVHPRCPVEGSVEHENETPLPLHVESPVARAVAHVKVPRSPEHA
ncbi:MAG: hypothetical protein ACXVQ5_10120, partial [Actinomycetota bacterium]